MDLNSIDEGDFGLLLGGGSGVPSSTRLVGAPRPKRSRTGAKAKRVSLDCRRQRRRPPAAAGTSAGARPWERARAGEPSASDDDSDDDAAISSLRSSRLPRREDGAPPPPPAAATTRDGPRTGRGRKCPGSTRQLGMRSFLSGAGPADDSGADEEERLRPARGRESISTGQRPDGKRANPFITAGAALVQSAAAGGAENGGPAVRATVPIDRVRGAFDERTDFDEEEEESWFDPAGVGIRVGKRTRLDPDADGGGGERVSRYDAGGGPRAADGAPRRSPDEGGEASRTTAPGGTGRDAVEGHRRGLNRRVFGLRPTVVGHRLPALDPDRGGHRAMSPAELGGVSVVASLLFRRSCLSSTPNIAAGLAGRAAVHASGPSDRGRADTVRLVVPPGSGEVTAMSFDVDGVLLASGDGRGNVRVYDFDDVRSADVAARNERSRRDEWDLRDESGDGDDEDDGEGREGPDLSTEGDVQDSEGPSEPLDDAENSAEVKGEPDETDPTEGEAATPPHEAVPVEPLLSFRCKAGASISRILWSPDHQDHLAVSFANDPSVRLYDVGSSRSPPPCLRLGESRQSSSEGVLSVCFLTPSAGTTAGGSSSVLTGGSRGTARLWTYPRSRRGRSLSSVAPRLVWSFGPFKDRDEGVGALLRLPSRPDGPAWSKGRPPALVLAAGLASSLVLLDAGKVTRKAFSTAVTPTVVASWDLHGLVRREMSKLFAGGVDVPGRGWTGINAMELVDHRADADGKARYRISMATRSGWLLSADLATDGGAGSATLRIGVAHHPPRIRVYSSDGRRLGSAGGMALRFSLPEHAAASSFRSSGRGVWMADVRGLRYTMPGRDRYVLCERHGAVTAETSDGDASRRAQGEGLILLDTRGCLTRAEGGESDGEAGEHVLARLPLADNNPACLAQHPGGEFVVVSYRANSSATTRMELVHLRKLP